MAMLIAWQTIITNRHPQSKTEIKGYRGEDAKDKKLAMDAFWVPGVNHLKSKGRWALAEF